MPSSTEEAAGEAGASAVPRGRARDIALALAVAAGIALCLVQYGANRSLFIDDISIALNLRELRLPELLRGPLIHAQIAPAGWLAAQKAITGVLGFSEHALRLLPLLSAFAAVIGFALAARRLLPGPAAVLATAWLATMPTLVNYGSQVKQYATDVAAAVAFLLLGLAALRPLDRGRAVGLALGGVALLVLSQAAVLVGAAVGLALLVEALAGRDRARLPRLAIVLAAWGVAAALVTVWSLSTTPADLDAYMNRFWRHSFLAMPPRSFGDLFAAWVRLRDTFLVHLAAPWDDLGSKIAAALGVLGAVSLLRRRRDAGLLVVLPIVFAIGASAARVLPMELRVMLFAVPFVLLLVAEGAGVVARAVSRLLRGRVPRPAATAAAALVLAACFAPRAATLARFPPPYGTEHPRPFLQAVAPRVAPGDVVYVHHELSKGFAWYGEPVRRRAARVVEGRCATGSPQRYIRELDALRGDGRVWVLLRADAFGESLLMGRFLHGLGAVRDSVAGPVPAGQGPFAYALLADLSVPAATGEEGADRFEIPASFVRPSFGWACYGFYRDGWSDSLRFALP